MNWKLFQMGSPKGAHLCAGVFSNSIGKCFGDVQQFEENIIVSNFIVRKQYITHAK